MKVVLTKSNQKLRQDLLAAASLLEQSSIDILKAANAQIDAGNEAGGEEFVKLALSHQDAEVTLQAYADQVKTGQMTKVECTPRTRHFS